MDEPGFLRSIIQSVFTQAGVTAGLSVMLNVYLFWQLSRERKQHEDDNRIAREDAKATLAAQVENTRRYDQFVATLERVVSRHR